MFKGIDHEGICVSNMDKSLEFYSEQMRFTKIIFDYTGILPGMEGITGKKETKARIVMLDNENKGPIGSGKIKLVYLLPPDKAKPIPTSEIWGQTGISEVGLNARKCADLFRELIPKGIKPVSPPSIPEVEPPFDNNIISVAYIADPDGGKVELTEWSGSWPGFGTDPRIEGLNHIGFGVSNMDKAKEFYRKLGFIDEVVYYEGYVDPHATWYDKPTKVKFSIIANYHGAWIEPIEHIPASKEIDNNWGRLGPMEFAVGVSNIEKAFEDLKKEGIKFHSSPQTLEVSAGEWKYVYIIAPDNLCVSLVEARY